MVPKPHAEIQAKYHNSRKDDEVYRAKRREQDKLSKREARKAEKIRLESGGPHKESKAKRARSHTEEPVLQWKPINTIKKNQLPTVLEGEIILPPESLQGDNAMAAMVLEGVSEYLTQNWEEQEMCDLWFLATCSLPKITGIRSISGNRYELYVRVKDSTPAAFYTLLRYSERLRRKDPDLVLGDNDLCELVDMIVGFASDRVFTKDKISKTTYELQNFAYIVTYGDVEKQDVHIDLCKKTQFQFGMLCSPLGDLTSEYKSGDPNFIVEKGDKLSMIWNDMPASLKDKMDGIPIIQELIDDFGPLLSPSIQKVGKKSKKVPFGTVICLPGRVLHCGPKVEEVNKVRAVLFFTATPIADLALAYDSEIQYCRSSLIHDFLLHSWPTLLPTEKVYFLNKWKTVGLSHDSIQAITLNMSHKHLKVMALAIKKTKDKGLLAGLISRIAYDDTWNNEPDCEVRWHDVLSADYKIPSANAVNGF
jgi:hypothetical protein